MIDLFEYSKKNNVVLSIRPVSLMKGYFDESYTITMQKLPYDFSVSRVVCLENQSDETLEKVLEDFLSYLHKQVRDFLDYKMDREEYNT